MKKLLTLFLVAVCCSLQLMAQPLKVTRVTLLPGTEQGGFYHPRFSPKGSYLVTTAENYAGLNRHDLLNGTKRVLTTAEGAGYGLQISPDEQTVTYRRQELRQNIRHMSLEQINVSTGTQRTLRRMAPKAVLPAEAVEATFITIEHQKMVLHRAGKQTVLAPNGDDESYFWASVSPDERHIVYVTAHHGTYVCDIDGANPRPMGWLNAPQWMNNGWVVGMQDKDDGHVVLSSALVARAIDGTASQVLPTTQKVAMYPAVSADGKRIAFNTLEGQIYIMEVQL